MLSLSMDLCITFIVRGLWSAVLLPLQEVGGEASLEAEADDEDSPAPRAKDLLLVRKFVRRIKGSKRKAKFSKEQ